MLWKAHFFTDLDDQKPSRVGYFQAASDEDAQAIAVRLLADDEIRVDFGRVALRSGVRLPPGALLK